MGSLSCHIVKEEAERAVYGEGSGSGVMHTFGPVAHLAY